MKTIPASKIEEIVPCEDGTFSLITFNGIVIPYTKEEFVEFVNENLNGYENN